jgi:hypothetical protein
MKWVLIVALLFSTIGPVCIAQESLGTKIKKAFGPSPTPSRKHRKKKATPTPPPESSPKRKKASPSPSPTPSPKSKSKRKRGTPTPTPTAEETPSPTPGETPSPAEQPAKGKKGWPNVSLSPDQIEGYADETKFNVYVWLCRSEEWGNGLLRICLLCPSA